MQTILIAVLIVIAGLIGALLACATSLINRVRAANITLRRIEETLLSINRVKAIDTAIKSTTPAAHSQPTETGGAGFLTVRELKVMATRARASADSAAVPTGRKPSRTSVSSHSTLRREPTFEPAVVTPTKEMFAASEHPDGLDSIVEISWPKRHDEMASIGLRKGIDAAKMQASQIEVTEATHPAAAKNGELLIQESSEALEEASITISPPIRETSPEASTPTGSIPTVPTEAPHEESAVAIREMPEARQESETAPTGGSLEESRRKKKTQELLLIMSSRRRRARAGR